MIYGTGLLITKIELTLCCNLKVQRSFVLQDFCVFTELFSLIGPQIFFDLYSLNCLKGTEIVILGSII